MSSLHDWRSTIDLSPLKAEIESLSEQREKQKYGYKTSRQWSKEATNLTGLKGEFAFSMCTGLPVDRELKSFGDSGVDFEYGGITYDVKTTLYKGADPMLIEMTMKRLIPSVYVLVAIDGWQAKIVGWCSKVQMRHASTVDLGHGDRLCVRQSEMRKLGQDTIPPCVPSVSTSKRAATSRAKKQLDNTKEIIKLPPAGPNLPHKRHCFPHGPFVERRAIRDQRPALYCGKCGRFYGIKRSEDALLVEGR